MTLLRLTVHSRILEIGARFWIYRI